MYKYIQKKNTTKMKSENIQQNMFHIQSAKEYRRQKKKKKVENNNKQRIIYLLWFVLIKWL